MISSTKTSHTTTPNLPAPPIDVVIPTRDRPEQLLVTLEALTRQSFSDFGVVVVDDGSHSDIAAECPSTLREELGIRFVRNGESLGAGPARNRGVENSEARYVIFIDDDCIAGPDLVRWHYETLAEVDEPVVSLGPILAVAGCRLPVWSHWDAYQLEREYGKLASGQVEPDWGHLFTGNVGLRRADFLAISGFDERFPRGEDTELGYRLANHGCRFEFDSDAFVCHDSQRSLHSWINIAAAAALSDIEMQQRDPESHRLAMMAEQLRSRHWALRLTRKLFGGPIAARCAIAGALTAGVALHAIRADRLSFFAMSVVRDLTYWRTLRNALAHVSDRQSPMEVA